MNIFESTAAYERWLRQETSVIEDDLEAKHELMAASSFVFLRATFYRWAQLWLQNETEDSGPRVHSVGDIHIENFGSWRDLEGRLAWGVNDFDEAFALPYTFDLVRLATSVQLAVKHEHIHPKFRESVPLLLRSYRESLLRGGAGFVLSEKNQALRELIKTQLKKPRPFWTDLLSESSVKNVPKEVQELVNLSLPIHAKVLKWIHRRAGAGSLGRPRFTAIVLLNHAYAAREAKAMVPSACSWLDPNAKPTNREIFHETPARSGDPFLRFRNNWVIRRLSPDCTKIDLREIVCKDDVRVWIPAMGWEIGNVHLISGKRRQILKDLEKRKSSWFQDKIEEMVSAVTADWKKWKRGNPADS